ncbi:glycosyltransferase [Paracoccus sp. (in: a-proteobacteria)]|uniref:glycosyltransferase n=1 Tax=Paracoccus sp. TaxID=267 RepID=UPI0026DF887A|nr:glycosyltransferase [Paracoccus sp. (in: a-proteobacteria)]MDO5646747.1 glycosyltransferase [Paracoccus sp. (in: a-proteobacteria)]
MMKQGEVTVAIIHPSVDEGGRWIDDFVDPAAPYRFVKFGPNRAPLNWHKRGKTTTRAEWRNHFAQAYRAMKTRPDLVVASFPPLTFACCVLKTLMFSKTRIIGWSFNFGGASKSKLAAVYGRVFRRAAALVVHSTAEIAFYARAFGLAPDRLRFIPYQQGELTAAEPDECFDLVAMGSAGRDYAALCDAVRGTGLRVLVIAKPSALNGIDIPDEVECRADLTLPECHSLSLSAPLAVLPVSETSSAAGQVTVLIAMAQGRAIIATRCPGTEDYLTDGVDSVLVPPHDSGALRDAILALHSDPDRASRLGQAAQATWQQKYSDPAAGQNLRALLDEVTGK